MDGTTVLCGSCKLLQCRKDRPSEKFSPGRTWNTVRPGQEVGGTIVKGLAMAIQVLQ